MPRTVEPLLRRQHGLVLHTGLAIAAERVEGGRAVGPQRERQARRMLVAEVRERLVLQRERLFVAALLGAQGGDVAERARADVDLGAAPFGLREGLQRPRVGLREAALHVPDRPHEVGRGQGGDLRVGVGGRHVVGGAQMGLAGARVGFREHLPERQVDLGAQRRIPESTGFALDAAQGRQRLCRAARAFVRLRLDHASARGLDPRHQAGVVGQSERAGQVGHVSAARQRR